MTRLVAFTGPAGAGKSQASLALDLSLGYERRKFAGPLKAMLTALYTAAGLHPAEIVRRIEGDLKEVPDPLLGGKTPRYAMQTLGTEWGRQMIHEDLWVNIWRAGAEQRLDAECYVVADDCRFENEAEAVRALGGKVVRITGRGGIGSEHVSEAGVEPDFEIANTGSVSELNRALRAAFGGDLD